MKHFKENGGTTKQALHHSCIIFPKVDSHCSISHVLCSCQSSFIHPWHFHHLNPFATLHRCMQNDPGEELMFVKFLNVLCMFDTHAGQGCRTRLPAVKHSHVTFNNIHRFISGINFITPLCHVSRDSSFIQSFNHSIIHSFMQHISRSGFT